MGEGGVAKGAGEAAGDGDEGQRCEDAGRGNDGGDGPALGRRRYEVDAPDRGGEEGLDRVEEYGEVPDFGGVGGAVRCRCELLLEVGPRQAIFLLLARYVPLLKDPLVRSTMPPSRGGIYVLTRKRRCLRRQ